MPSMPRSDLTPYQTPSGYVSWDCEWAGVNVGYEKSTQPIDATEKFSLLPGGGCLCPHWGYVLKGKSTYVFDDHEEVYEAGEFFYLPPGHRPKHEAGTEWICFSPAEEHKRTQSLSRHRQDAGSAEVSALG